MYKPTDKTITLEAAKLLGVTFSWHPMLGVYKYMATANGPLLFVCEPAEWVWRPAGLISNNYLRTLKPTLNIMERVDEGN